MGPGTPREGWDHAEAWLPHAVSLTGLRPRIITAELTMADVNPAMADLKPLAAESLRRALAAIDQLWTADKTPHDASLVAVGLHQPKPHLADGREAGHGMPESVHRNLPRHGDGGGVQHLADAWADERNSE